eukprot:35177_1
MVQVVLFDLCNEMQLADDAVIGRCNVGIVQVMRLLVQMQLLVIGGCGAGIALIGRCDAGTGGLSAIIGAVICSEDAITVGVDVAACVGGYAVYIGIICGDPAGYDIGVAYACGQSSCVTLVFYVVISICNSTVVSIVLVWFWRSWDGYWYVDAC